MKKLLLFLLVAVMMLGCFISVSAKEETTINVLEDAFVKKGEADINFGGEPTIDLKSNNGDLTRYGYLKFDISSLVGVTDYTCIDLELTVETRQPEMPMATVEVYGAANKWSESSLNFNIQPKSYDYITANTEITDKSNKSYLFSITDYIRQALANGETEISLYLVENTPDMNQRTNFYSKENGEAEKAPKLIVYYGTKTDDQTYGKPPYVYVPSQNGIDTFIGKPTTFTYISADADTYVEGGKNMHNNYGREEILDFKAKNGSSTSLYRVALIRFDISSLEGPVTLAEFSLNCKTMEAEGTYTALDIFGCDPYSWEEDEVTFSTRPAKEDYVASYDVVLPGVITIDITNYVNEAIANKEKMIALFLDGDDTQPLRLNFDSKESSGIAPMLFVKQGELNFATNVVYEGENPWDVAAEGVSAWFNRWEEIKALGDHEYTAVVKDAEEYSVVVDGADSANGYETKYIARNTRTLDTLKNFTENNAETAIYDIYGGLMDESMRQEATGFFYTKKIGDRWWTFDPLGYPFYRVACVQVIPGESKNHKAAVVSTHGSDEAWAVYVTDRLKDLGFNSTGGWSNTKLLLNAQEPLAQTEILSVLNMYCSEVGLNLESHGSTEMVGNVLPVFDPTFETYTDKRISSKVAAYANKPYIYGWMSDNELPDELDMLDAALEFDPNNPMLVYSYATAWTFMYLKTGKEDVSLADVTDELRTEFRAMLYNKYYEVVSYNLEKYDPEHLYMGSRLLVRLINDEYLMRVSGYYCDVITMNYYFTWEADPDYMANFEKWSGKPFIVTEWYAKGMDVWEQDERITNKSGAGFTVRTQEDRGLFYQNYALMLLEAKNCVGFDWFRLWDNDPENLDVDSSNRDANKGIYSNTYEEYTALTSAMEKLNNQKYYLINFFDER